MGKPNPDLSMTADELRRLWSSFFAARQHELLPAASLVPENDPTLLFTGAGMNQFKDLFLGRGTPPYRRAATVQPCFRQGDLENVGRTPRHLTFFEMLGHFSFGDYFKKEAIAWAWEFLTDVLGMPKNRLVVSVYEKDDEAFDAWRAVGLDRDRIARFDAKENFWPANAPAAGPNGVCGPCSEVFFDYGEAFEVGDGSPQGYDSGRFIEIWNSVFTQYDRRGPDDLAPLPQKNIDCGVGFERVLAMIEGENSMFGTSLFRPIMAVISEITGREYAYGADGTMPEGDDPRRMRRIADHVRAGCFLVSAGVKPGNEGRGYVLRRILRLAIRDGIQLGLAEPFLTDLIPSVVRVMQGGYPELAEGEAVLASVIGGEEERFRATYDQGVRFLEDAAKGLSSGGVLDGKAAFKLYDTYGFPVDLAARILEHRGITVDRAGFEAEMTKQRERARAGSKISDSIFAGGPVSDLKANGVPQTEFLGYEHTASEATVVGIIADEALVDAAEAGTDLVVVLDRTPFYAESGGQVGDQGRIVAGGMRVDVSDTQAKEGYTLHAGRVADGRVAVGDTVRAEVDEARRDAIRRNHTATHLLQSALQQVLGDGVRQEGSLVGPDHLRFDFCHPRALTAEELGRVEDLVNDWILRNDALETEDLPIQEAKASGATSLFGEKYGDRVRVVSVASGSKELCGGTHCHRTGDIGSFRVSLETSIAAGVRRIEALTGYGATTAAARDRRVVRELATRFKAAPEEILERIDALQDELKAVRKAEEKARREAGLRAVASLVETAEDIDGIRVQIAALPGVDGKSLRGVWEGLAKGGVDVALILGEADGRVPLLVGLSKAAAKRGLDARKLLGEATEAVGGRGGGKPDLAQGQGTEPGRAEEALTRVRARVRSDLGA